MSDVKFTIATLVTDHDEYTAMRDTFTGKGFVDDCEFLILDNSKGNAHDAYSGYNWILQKARGEFVIFSHQDVRLDFDGRQELEARLAELEELDPTWAVVGNAGGLENGSLVIRITDPGLGPDYRQGSFPSQVCSLDSNFILVKNETRVAFSRDLQGFDFYGSDICLQAEIRGYRAYVIDFHVHHLSSGKTGKAFLDARVRFLKKWEYALRRRCFRTTCDFFLLEGETASAAVNLTSAEDFLELGWYADRAGDYHGSLAAALSAIEVEPESAHAWSNLCVAYNQLQMFEEAKGAGREAVRLCPENHLARNNLAFAERQSAALSGRTDP